MYTVFGINIYIHRHFTQVQVYIKRSKVNTFDEKNLSLDLNFKWLTIFWINPLDLTVRVTFEIYIKGQGHGIVSQYSTYF